MKRTKWLFLLIVTNLLISCAPNPKKTFHCEIPPIQSSTSKSDHLKVEVYLDGSGSMLGYVKDGETNYVKVLRSLKSTLDLRVSDNWNVEYYRLGNESQKLTPPLHYSDAELPVFYDESDRTRYPGASSPIDTAITPVVEKENKLTVIVTDLEQNDGDVTRITQKIQQNYLNEKRKNYAVGIWTIKSEFNGSVYIEKLLEKEHKLNAFTYNSGKQLDKMRPFYVLFIGSYGDISYYFDQLQKSYPDLVNSNNLVIFNSDNILSRKSSLQNLPANLPKGLTRPVLLVKNVQLEKYNQSKDGSLPYDLLEIDGKAKDSLTANYSVPLITSNYSLPIDPKSLKTEVKIQRFDEYGKDINSENDDLNLKTAMDLKNWQINPSNTLNFSAIIDPNKFPKPGIYLFTIDVKANNLQSDSSWKDWDWEARTSEQDGSKTHNVKFFLETLKHRTEELNQNSLLVGRFCYAIQKD